MTNLQILLAEKFPDNTEISHIQRDAFLKGYEAGVKAAETMVMGILENFQKEVNSKI